jgi:hypothetical protein
MKGMVLLESYWTEKNLNEDFEDALLDRLDNVSAATLYENRSNSWEKMTRIVYPQLNDFEKQIMCDIRMDLFAVSSSDFMNLIPVIDEFIKPSCFQVLIAAIHRLATSLVEKYSIHSLSDVEYHKIATVIPMDRFVITDGDCKLLMPSRRDSIELYAIFDDMLAAHYDNV